MEVRVASASETADSERATIAKGTPASELMRRAGEGAADLIADRYGDTLTDGVAVFTGAGNNGGDGWVVAEALSRKGFRSVVIELAEPRTREAHDARAHALAERLVSIARARTSQRVIVDALLGTGSRGSPRGTVTDTIAAIAQSRKDGAAVVSLDLPSGLDATSGSRDGSVVADLTVSFGNVKRGQLIARDVCGRIAVVDIGLDATGTLALPLLVDRQWVTDRVPVISSSAHKGTRKRLAVVGGGRGMAGAAILAGEGALRSGIGLLCIATAVGNEVAIHAGIPAAVVVEWPADSDSLAKLVESADAIAIGPGLGRSSLTRDLVERILLAWNGPVVLDADALNVFEGDVASLARLLQGRQAAITPHPAELGRLIGMTTADVLEQRFDVGIELSVRLGAAVLLKGSPTVVFAPSGERFVSAAGTAALATGGSGDVLTGMIGTMMAQMCTPDSATTAAEAAACAAFVHGRAAELCGFVRGVTLDDILRAMPYAWNEASHPLPSGVLAMLEGYAQDVS